MQLHRILEVEMRMKEKKKYEQPLGVKLERCSKMKDERPKRKGAMYMVTVPTVSPLFELCRQRGFFFCIGLRFFFLPFPLLHTLTIIPYYCSVSLCFLYTINLALNLCWSNCGKKKHLIPSNHLFTTLRT